jgi:two-component system, response regulator RegA
MKSALGRFDSIENDAATDGNVITAEPSISHGGARDRTVRAPGNVLIVDSQEPSSRELARSFCDLGYTAWRADTPDDAAMICEISSPVLVLTELKIGGYSAFDLLSKLRVASPDSPIIVCTSYPSISSAVRAVRRGFDGYFAKPVSADTILQTVSLPKEECSCPLSPGISPLNRVVWEYINQVYVSAGNISEAARRLRLDRRSLRRMLHNVPRER